MSWVLDEMGRILCIGRDNRDEYMIDVMSPAFGYIWLTLLTSRVF